MKGENNFQAYSMCRILIVYKLVILFKISVIAATGKKNMMAVV